MSAQNKSGSMRRRSAFQAALEYAQRPNPIRERRELEARRQSIKPDILMIEGVARLLGCSVQSVRNISATDLPRYDGPGRSLLFFKEDVLRYVRANPKTNPAVDELVRDIENDLLDSPSDSGDTASQEEK